MPHPSSDDPWLDLLHALRERTGITPIPLSEAERRCGLLEAFAGATPSPPPPQQTTTVPEQPWKPLPGDTRRAALARIRAAIPEQMRAAIREQVQQEITVTTAPTAPSTPQSPTLPPKKVAVHLATYRKTSR
ncbi:MAG: hypothetical protein H7835_11190 [Magnetococcus sp. XQGC-1]